MTLVSLLHLYFIISVKDQNIQVNIQTVLKQQNDKINMEVYLTIISLSHYRSTTGIHNVQFKQRGFKDTRLSLIYL